MRDAEAARPRRQRTGPKRAPAGSPAPCKQLFVNSRLAAMRDRVAKKARASLVRPFAACIVEALAVTESGSRPAGMRAAVGRAPRNKRTRCQFVSTAIAADVPGGSSPATSYSHSSGSRLEAGAHARGSSGACDERSAEADLLELEKCGLRIAHPYQRYEHSTTQPIPAKLQVPTCSASNCRPSSIRGREALPEDPQIAAALNDLAELQDCGLSVKWPC